MVCQDTVSWLLRLLTAFYICRLTSFTNWENIHSLLLVFLFLRLRIPKPRTVCMLGEHYSAIISQRGEKSSPPSSTFSSWSPDTNKGEGFCPMGFWSCGPRLPWFPGSVLAFTGFHKRLLRFHCSDWVIWMAIWRTRAHCCLPPSVCRGFWSHLFMVKWMLGFAVHLPMACFFLFMICHESSSLFTQAFFLYPHIVTHANHSSTQVAEAGRLWVQAHSLLHERTLSQTKTKEKTF